MKPIGKYIAVFVITSLMFVTAFLASRELDNKRTVDVGAIRDDIAFTLSADEMNFALLRNSPCSSVNRSLLTEELNKLGSRISVLASNQGWEDGEVLQLRKQYILLQVQDYLLTKEMTTRCEAPEQVMIAFVRDAHCQSCEGIRALLQNIQDNHPEMRLYTIDAGVDIEVVDTLMKLYGVDENHLPAIFFNEIQIPEDQLTFDGLEKLFPDVPTEPSDSAPSPKTGEVTTLK